MEPMVFTLKHMLGVVIISFLTVIYIGINWKHFGTHYRFIFSIISLLEIGVLATVDTHDWLYFIFVFALTGWIKQRFPRARSEWSERKIKDTAVLPRFYPGSWPWHFTNSMYAYAFVFLVDVISARQ